MSETLDRRKTSDLTWTGAASSTRRPAGAEPGPVLEVRSVSVSYRRAGRDLPVLDGVSLQIDAGEAYGLVGESGCGKSTLAMTIMRHLGPAGKVTTGSVGVAGHEVLSLSESSLRHLRGGAMAMVYQEPDRALNPTMRVGDQVAEVFRFHRHRSRAEALEGARELFAKVALPDPGGMLRRYPHQLSGGQQQRVVIAMALAGSPRLLILDEPTTGLDATVEAEVLEVVAQLQAELGAAVLLISHNLGLVGRVCQRIGVLYAGRLVEEAPGWKVLRHPQHPYTAALIDCVPTAERSRILHPLIPIPGLLPALGTFGVGCRFAPRCSRAEERCRVDEPELVVLGAPGTRPGTAPPPGPDDSATGPSGTHRVACHRPGPEAGPPTAPRPAEPSGRRATRDGSVLLSVRDLEVRYGSTTACEQVTLDIHRGEVLGLVGESGSGKTSLGRALLGLAPVTAGSVALDGRVLERKASQRPRAMLERFQMVFQSPDSTLNPRHRVRQILQRSVDKLGSGRSVTELADAVQLSAENLDAYPAALSGGQKQRVAIARSFAGHPELVVCDEPVSALDVSVQAAILSLLGDLQAELGVAYLFVSHDLGVIRYLADRVAVMYGGQLVELGPVEQIFAPPHHPYTELLLSAVPSLDRLSERPSARLQPAGTTRPSRAGCRFAGRCPRAVAGLCDTTPPPWKQLDGDHGLRCHLGVEVLGEEVSVPSGRA